MIGDHATALITDSSRSIATTSLLPYSTQTLRSLLRESTSLSQLIITTATSHASSQNALPPSLLSSLQIRALGFHRNRRALHVYHEQRMECLKERYWSKGGVLSAAFGEGTEMRKNMVRVDEGFVKAYAELCRRTKSAWIGDEEDEGEDGVGLLEVLDLVGGGVEADPPKELFVTVRVLVDVGDVETVSGAKLGLTKGSQYFLAREDVENLVVQGYVEVIE